MPWWLQMLILIALLMSAGLLHLAIKNRFAKRTIRNWMGEGVHEGLSPVEAALLLGKHPSAIFGLHIISLALEGRAKILSEIPLAFEWTGERPSVGIEAPLIKAIGDDGKIGIPGVFDYLEELYDRVDQEMLAYSGRATAVYYRNFSRGLWDAFSTDGADNEGLLPWLLLAEPSGKEWDRVGEGEVEDAYRRSFRLRNRFVDRLISRAVYAEEVKQARRGFLALLKFV